MSFYEGARVNFFKKRHAVFSGILVNLFNKGEYKTGLKPLLIKALKSSKKVLLGLIRLSVAF